MTVGTYDQLATYLTDGYWLDSGRSARSFNHTNISVDISSLQAADQTMVLLALDTWANASGLSFSTTTSSADITFSSSSSGAYSNSFTSGSTILSSTVNVDTSWGGGVGADNYSYRLQTFIHEIGHALGLGHQGDYNSSASYPDDAIYDNDSWQTSIMSYFSQTENTTVTGTYTYVLTPQIADIIAIQSHYGTGTGQNGDTTYGVGNNTGLAVFGSAFSTSDFPSVTIFDTGGIDTLDYSGNSSTQTINLFSEGISSVFGETNNIIIARNTVIENAIGGTGTDTITGNSVANILTGNLGNDTLNGDGGNDTLYGDSTQTLLPAAISLGSGQITKSQGQNNNSIGAAIDISDEFSLASDADISDATSTPHVSITGTGNNTLDYYAVTVANAGAVITVDIDYAQGSGTSFDSYIRLLDASGSEIDSDDDSLTSEGAGGSSSGLDSYLSTALTTAGTYYIVVGAYSLSNPPTNIPNGGTYELQVSIAGELSSLGGNDKLYGGAGNDTLYGGAGSDTLYGEDNNDLIYVGFGDDTAYGGDGNDTFYWALDGLDTFYGGDGKDTFNARTSDEAIYINIKNQSGNSQATEGDLFDSVESFVGSNFDDTLRSGIVTANMSGYHGNDLLIGNNLNDYLRGDGGNDDVRGGNGNDTIIGGTGNDSMQGGKHADQFRFVYADFGQDEILDYQDDLDYFRFYSAVADDFSDFTITNNGTTEVTVTLTSDTTNFITLTGENALHSGSDIITLTADDFLFY